MKYPKCPLIYKAINKTLTKDIRLHNWTDADIKEEYGVSESTFRQKLKPSVILNDIHLSEYIQLLDNTADYGSLKQLGSRYGLTVIDTSVQSKTSLSLLTDATHMETMDVWVKGKKFMEDGEIDNKEREEWCKEIDEAMEWLAILKKQVCSNKEEE